jgi:hypothetical protein
MPSFKLPQEATYQQDDGSSNVSAVKKEAFDKFNPSVLGLGDIRNESIAVPCVAALFDLQGFTIFCKQIEPNLSVPIYLSGFLNWIFSAIRKETIYKEYSNGVSLYHELPFFTKFMGDGLLVLWNTRRMGSPGQHNLILSCSNILDQYRNEFAPSMRKKVSDVPPILRCGIAKGTVFSVGNGEDYVGSCINVAARLQKLAGLPIAFARRGFDPEEAWKEKQHVQNWLLRKVSIRGIGENELVYVPKKEFAALSSTEQTLFTEP